MMKFGIFAFWLVIAALFTAANPAQAQGVPASVLEPYQRHVAAMEAEDYRTALSEAQTAFEAGEAAEIDPATLSILARNIAETSVLLEDWRNARRWYREAAEIAERAELYAQMLGTLDAAVLAFVEAEDFGVAYRFARGATGAFEDLQDSGQAIGQAEIALGYQVYGVAAKLAFARASGRVARRYADAALEVFEAADAQPGVLYAELARISGIMATVQGDREMAWRRFASAQHIHMRLDLPPEGLRELTAWKSYVGRFVPEERRTEIVRDLIDRGVLPPEGVCPGGSCPSREDRPESCASGDYVAPEVIGERRTPEYPSSALLARAGGFVLMDFTVDAEGRVADMETVAAVPGDIFVDPSKDAMYWWRYTPAACNGVAVQSGSMVAFFNFLMEGSDEDDPEQWRLRRQ